MDWMDPGRMPLKWPLTASPLIGWGNGEVINFSQLGEVEDDEEEKWKFEHQLQPDEQTQDFL